MQGIGKQASKGSTDADGDAAGSVWELLTVKHEEATLDEKR